jgi:hypothetical protein
MRDILGLIVEVEEDASFGAQAVIFLGPKDGELEVVIPVVAVSLLAPSLMVASWVISDWDRIDLVSNVSLSRIMLDILSPTVEVKEGGFFVELSVVFFGSTDGGLEVVSSLSTAGGD